MLDEVLRLHLVSLVSLVEHSCWTLPLVAALSRLSGRWEVWAVASLEVVGVEVEDEVEDVGSARLFVGLEPVNKEAWDLEISAEEVSGCVEAVCLEVPSY